MNLFTRWFDSVTARSRSKGNTQNSREMLCVQKCVECGDHVPAYQKYLCEECWKEALNEKLMQADKE